MKNKKTKKNFLGRLFGHDLYLDTDNEVHIKYAKKFFEEQLKNAEAIRKIKEYLK